MDPRGGVTSKFLLCISDKPLLPRGLEDLDEIAADAVLAPGVVVSIEHIPSIKVMFGCRYGGTASWEAWAIPREVKRGIL